MKRKASIATAAVFLAVLFGFSLLHLALPDREVSRSERRRLAQLPPLSSGFSDKLEEYMLDQFPLREQLRTVNSLVRLYGLGQADIHGIYLQGGGAFRMDGPLQEKQVRHAAAVFSAVQEKYFPSLPAHYVIVPDKNAKAETSRPRLDTETMRGIVREALPGMTEIDIWDLLSADDYYKTDPHWRQETLLPVAQRLAEALHVTLPEDREETLCALAGEFHGSYWSKTAETLAADTLSYLTDDVLEGCTVYDYETDSTGGVYDFAAAQTAPYDLFLGGSKSLLRIENPAAENERTLIVFRDSFGSSLIPLLAEGYGTVYAVDIRYLASDLLGRVMDIPVEADVLFLYSATVLHNSVTLK